MRPGRRILRLVDIVEPAQRRRVPVVEFEDDALGPVEERRGGADAAGEGHLPARLHITNFDHGPVEISEEAVADSLGQLRQVHVEKLRLASVDALAKFGIALVRRAKFDRIAGGEDSVQGRPGAGSRDHADGKRTPRGMFLDGARRQLAGHSFWGSRRGESAEAHHVVVVDQGRGFSGGDNRKARDHRPKKPFFSCRTGSAASASSDGSRNAGGKSPRLK